NVAVNTARSEDHYASQTRIGPDGRFELLGLPPGDHVLRFEPRGEVDYPGMSPTYYYDGTAVATREVQDAVTIAIRRGTHLDLQVEVDAGSALSGRVTDLAGDPLASWSVAVDRRVDGQWWLA